MQPAPIKLEPQISSEQGEPLVALARQLARHQIVARSSEPNTLLREHLLRCSQSLHDSYHFFRALPSKDVSVSRAGEWMLDNYYVIQQTLRQISQDLPQSYYHQLFKLNSTEVLEASTVCSVEKTRWPVSAAS